MRLQDQIVRQTQRAVDDFLRAIAAIPVDHLEWAPEGGRHALSQLQEVAMVPDFYLIVLRTGSVPVFDDHAKERVETLRASLSTIDECREGLMRMTSELCQAIRDFPDQRLEEEVVLPFNGGMRVTMGDVLGLHYWNTVYHLGQINYLQTLLGDREMH
jgi:uncharacterized damage-inducible protein DinB